MERQSAGKAQAWRAGVRDVCVDTIEPAEETGDSSVDELQSSPMFGSKDYRYQPGSQQCPGSSAKNSEPPGLQE